MGDSKRKYVSEIHDCYDLEQRLKFIEEEVLKNDIPIHEPSHIPLAPRPSAIRKVQVSFKHMYKTREDVMEY